MRTLLVVPVTWKLGESRARIAVTLAAGSRVKEDASIEGAKGIFRWGQTRRTVAFCLSRRAVVHRRKAQPSGDWLFRVKRLSAAGDDYPISFKYIPI